MIRAISGRIHSVFLLGMRTFSSHVGEVMLRKYRNEEEIYELLRLFETGTIARDKWKHAEHLVVALCYLRNDTLDGAYAKMRAGIFNLLRAFGVDLEKEMPYHETITVFWMRTAYAYMLMNENTSFVEMANGLCELYDKDHPLKFYSRELLFSDRARATFVEPDLDQAAVPAA